MRKTNAIKARKAKARNFGGEADAVRAMDCIVHTAAKASGLLDWQLRKRGWTACGGAACAHHAWPRQRGGVGEGRFGLFSGCARHGDEAGEASPIKGPSSKRRAFEAKYSVSVIATADRIALAHEPPLGVRGLAARWVASKVVPRVFDSTLLRSPVGSGGGTTPAVPPLEGYDARALLGWVDRRVTAIDGAAPDGEAELEVIVEALSDDLELDPEVALALFKATRGPS